MVILLEYCYKAMGIQKVTERDGISNNKVPISMQKDLKKKKFHDMVPIPLLFFQIK
jgi:hypothetical protein